MKHDKKNMADRPMTREQILGRIGEVNGKMRMMSMEINDIISERMSLKNRKLILQMKVSNAQKYLNQLREQLEGMDETETK
jgi:hypothetical protein